MSTGEGSHVRRDLLHEVVLHGTWLYAGEIPCDVQIIHTNFRPGSGDYEDPPEIEENQYGDFYSIQDGSTTERGHYPAGSGYYDLLEEAVAAVALATHGTIVWDRDLTWTNQS